MIILRGDNENVDFERPLRLEKEQLERFINYFKESFYFIEVVEMDSSRSKRIGDKFFIRDWSVEEDSLLFDITKTTEEVPKMLGRSWMSVDIRRGQVIPQILDFARKEEVDIYKVDIKKLIEKYRKEHQEEILSKRKERSEELRKKREREKEYDQLKQDIPKFEALIDSPISQITKEELEEKKRRLKELKEKIEG